MSTNPATEAEMEDIQTVTPEVSEAEDIYAVDPLSAEIEAKLTELKNMFGEENVTEIVADVYFDPDVAAFVMECEDVMKTRSEALNNKARFFLHREPNGDLYLLNNLKPSEWKTQWLQILTGDQSAADKYGDEILKASMLYPSFDQTDWDYEGGEKMHRPMGLTKSRLIGTFFTYEIQDPTQDNTVAFDSKSIDTALAAAKSAKPSL